MPRVKTPSEVSGLSTGSLLKPYHIRELERKRNDPKFQMPDSHDRKGVAVLAKQIGLHGNLGHLRVGFQNSSPKKNNH
jgi:hypothetical protein